MSMMRLNPPEWCLTPKGPGRAIIVINEGPDFNTVYVVILDEGGHYIHVDSSEMRGTANPTYDLGEPKPFNSREIK